MPLIEPKTFFDYNGESVHGSQVQVFVVKISGTSMRQLEMAKACNTDEGWVDIWITDPSRNNKILVIDGVLQSTRLHVRLEVRHKDGRVLYPIK